MKNSCFLYLLATPLVLISYVVCLTPKAYSQGSTGIIIGQDTTQRIITTALPFLTITPDSRAAGMGDVGVATSPDANAMYWNAAKLAFIEKDYGVSLCFTPWLARIVNDMSISYLAGYMKISKQEVVGVALKYFTYGDINLRNNQNVSLGDFTPREFTFDASYSRKLSNTFSVAVLGRLLHSNLTGNFNQNIGTQVKSVLSASADVSLFGQKDFLLNKKNTLLTYGLNISNIGPKVTYSNPNNKEAIPTNFRIGAGLTTELDPYNKLTIAMDMNKLMVPTPPAGNKSLLGGMFGSFADAPDGLKEELQEIILSWGAEYAYNDLFFGRLGYFYENPRKGNRNYFTFGLGLKYKSLGFDVAYLVSHSQANPLAETLRFSLRLDFNKKSKVENSAVD